MTKLAYIEGGSNVYATLNVKDCLFIARNGTGQFPAESCVARFENLYQMFSTLWELEKNETRNNWTTIIVDDIEDIYRFYVKHLNGEPNHNYFGIIDDFLELGYEGYNVLFLFSGNEEIRKFLDERRVERISVVDIDKFF